MLLQVENSLQQLQSELTSLKDHACVRRLRLLDAVESQMFYTEAVEAENWILEKRQILTSSDVGNDEDSIAVNLILCWIFYHSNLFYCLLNSFQLFFRMIIVPLDGLTERLIAMQRS